MNLKFWFRKKNRAGYCPKCGDMIFRSDKISRREYVCYNCYLTFPKKVFKCKSIRVIYRGKGTAGKNPIKIRWKKKQTQKKRKKKRISPINSYLRWVNTGSRFIAHQRRVWLEEPISIPDLW